MQLPHRQLVEVKLPPPENSRISAIDPNRKSGPLYFHRACFGL